MTGRPSTSVSSAGGSSGGGGGQRVEVSRAAPRDPLQFQPQHQQQLQSHQQNLHSEHLQGRHAAFDVSPPRQRTAPQQQQQQQSKSPSEEDNNMWGFNGSAAANPHANATAPSSLSHTVTPRGPDIDRGHDNSRGIRDRRDSRDQWGEDRENYRESRDRMSEPVLDRPLSNPVANVSIHHCVFHCFVTCYAFTIVKCIFTAISNVCNTIAPAQPAHSRPARRQQRQW